MSQVNFFLISSKKFYSKLLLLRLRDAAVDLLISKKPRLISPDKSEKRTVRLIDPEASHRNKPETHLKKIETLEKLRGENAEKMKKMVSDLEDAKEEIETVTAEKMELEERLKNCQKADEDKKQLREEVENQKIIITKLEKKNEETKKQLKFQGKYLI